MAIKTLLLFLLIITEINIDTEEHPSYPEFLANKGKIDSLTYLLSSKSEKTTNKKIL